MALNKEVFRTRATSAVIFVIIMLTGLLWNGWSLLLLFSIIHFGCWWEYLNLVAKIYGTSFNRFTRLGWMLSGYGVMLLFTNGIYTLGKYGIAGSLYLPLSVAGFLLLVIGIVTADRKRAATGRRSVPALAGCALGLLYISMSWGMFVGLQGYFLLVQEGPVRVAMYVIPVVLIASIWINDTMAYLVGSFIGRTPFSPISPKKTWEGTAGGAVLCVGVMSAVAHYLFNLQWIPSVAIPVIAAIVGTAGDLLESKLKRMAAVKDSGSMMPGHGGFMDRFDSLLLATPVVYLFVYLFASQLL